MAFVSLLSVLSTLGSLAVAFASKRLRPAAVCASVCPGGGVEIARALSRRDTVDIEDISTDLCTYAACYLCTEACVLRTSFPSQESWVKASEAGSVVKRLLALLFQ